MKKILLILFFVFAVAWGNSGYASEKTVEATGEAQIINNDLGAAKNQAIVRAKWAALEKAAEVKVKVETIVQNAQLVDEAIKSEVSGAVSSYSVADEGKDGDTYWIKIMAKVSTDSAQKAVGAFAKNTSVSVLLPVVFPDGRVEESSPLSEKVINELNMQNFEIVDIAASGNPYNIHQLDSAMKDNNFMVLRSLAFQHLSGVLLVGKVESIASAREGKSIGYGISLPFNIVNGKLTYRLIGDKQGQKVILAGGYISGRGQGPSVEDATYNMLENLAYNANNELISTILEKIKGINNKKIEVILAGNADVSKLLNLKNDLQYIAWVLNIQEQGTDRLILDYPEKSIYLANAISQKGLYRIRSLDDRKIVLESNR